MSIWPTSRDRSERSVGSSSTPSTESSIGASSCSSRQGGRAVDDLADEPHVVLDQLLHQVHGGHLVSRGQPKAAGWVEVHAVRAVEVDRAGRRAPGRRPDPVGATERTGERLVRRVAGLERHLEDARFARHEPVGRTLEEHPAAQPCGSLPGHGRHHPVEVEARQAGARRQVLPVRLVVVEALRERVHEGRERVHQLQGHAVSLPPRRGRRLIVLAHLQHGPVQHCLGGTCRRGAAGLPWQPWRRR